MEKRDNRRKRIRVTLSAEPGSIRAFTGDLSYNGLFVVSAKVLPPGTRIRLQVHTKEGVALGVGVVRWARRVPMEVMRDIKGGMGVEFTWISAELKKFIDGNMG